MTFVIEALGLTAGGGKAGLMRLVPALARRTDHRFVALAADLPEFAPLAGGNVKLLVRRKPHSLIARELYLQRDVPRICAAEQADALLCLGNFAPRRGVVPAVILLHNAQYASQSHAPVRETARQRLVNWYGRRMMRRLPAGARLVVQTPLMKRRVCAAYPRLTGAVTVIPDADGLPGPPPAFLDGAPFRRADRHSEGTETPFTFLCLSRYYPHKNLESLVEAFRELRRLTSRPVRCLLTIDPRQHPGARRLLERIETGRLAGMLVNIGPLTGARVWQAYGCADAFILPTLLESFGRTYSEAMRCGLPVLTSDRDFAHEACGQAALYFDPLRPASMALRMIEVMESAGLRARLSRAGLQRASQAPSWEEIAGQFIRLLEQAGRQARGFGKRSSELDAVSSVALGSL
jgi:glycosyltransferase involved in cell wall biosynthesis